MIITRPLFRQYIVVATVNLMVLCVGMDLGWTSPVLVKLRDPAQTQLSRPITDDESGWLVSIGFILSVLSLPCTGLLVDYVGRKYSILMVSIPKIIAGVMTIYATEVWILLVARGIHITMDNAAVMVTMMYSTEIANKEIRGSLCSIITMLSCSGALIMLGVGPYVSYLHLCVLMTAVTVCACVPLLFIPDTPYSLYKRGKVEEAKKVLIFFRGSETLADEEIKEFCQIKPKERFDKKEIFKNKTYRKVLLIVTLMGAILHLNGFYFILLYLQTILELTNSNVSPALSSLIIGMIQVLSSIFACLVSDKFGRKLIIVSTLLGMALGMFGLGIFFALKQNGILISGFLNYLPLVTIALITWCYSGGLGSQYFALVTELQDDRIRALGTSASMALANFTIFLLSRYALAILSALSYVATFAMFGVLCVTMSLFVSFFVPETKHKTIADIQRALRGLKTENERKDYVTRF